MALAYHDDEEENRHSIRGSDSDKLKEVTVSKLQVELLSGILLNYLSAVKKGKISKPANNIDTIKILVTKTMSWPRNFTEQLVNRADMTDMLREYT